MITTFIVIQAGLFVADRLLSYLAGTVIYLQMRGERYASASAMDQEMNRRINTVGIARLAYAVYALAHWYVWIWLFLCALIVAVRRLHR